MEFLGEVGERIRQTRAQHGFQTTWENLPTKVMLVVTELAEAIEAHRTVSAGDLPDVGEYVRGEHVRPHQAWHLNKLMAALGEEFADAIIRILDICYSLEIPLEEQMELKLDANEKRPHLHGKRY